MTYEEMQTLVGFLRGAFPRLTEEQIDLYSEMLVTEDAQDASTAILEGIGFWKFPPSWAEIKENIRAVRARRPRAERRGDRLPARLGDARLGAALAVRPLRRLTRPTCASSRSRRGSRTGTTPKEGWMPEDAYVEEAKTVTPSQVRQLMKAYMEVGS